MLKKLIYKSHYRGTKEGDLLLSSFAKTALSDCSDYEQKVYADLLKFSDAQINEWILQPQKAPKLFKGMLQKIACFHHL